MKYIVIKKCYSNEFVSVEADSPQEAIDLAHSEGGKTLTTHLEFNGYQPKDRWQAEVLDESCRGDTTTTLGTHE